MREIVDLGLIRNFGVSNFTRSRLERAIALDLGPISVNQVEYHPYLNQKALDEFCKANGIVLTAYTPLAKGKVADDPLIRDIAEKYGKTPGQVTLRWLYQRGIVSVPKASSPEHQRGNLAIFDWELSPEDFAQIDNTGKWERIITWNVAEFED
jgi:diketogulonate reductase-like aldo/keto reductase